MWNDRRDRKLPSAIFRRQSVRQAKSTANNKFTSKIRVHPQPNVPRPTFTGAQDWVQRHRDDIDTVVQLLDIYPNLIQSEGLDPLWNFLQPVLNNKGTSSSEPDAGKEEGRTRKKSKGKGHAPNRRETVSRSFPDKLNARYVYVCDVHNSGELVRTKSAKERIVTSLSSYCYVRANPELPVSQADLMDVLNTVSSADAFLFLMNDKSVGSWFCLHQLGIAIAYNIPIIAVREAGYNLPTTLPSEFSRLEIVKAPVDEPPSPKLQQRVRSKSSENWPEGHAKSESQSSGFHSDSENVLYHQHTDNEKPVCALSDVIRECFHTSVVYVPNFHDSCIAKLFGRLSDYLGDIFLDAEVSKTEKRQRVRDSQSTDSDVSDRLPNVKGSSVFRTLSHHHSSNDEKQAQRTPSSDGSHDPPDTPTSTEKSSATPSSSPVKFPPIVPVPELPETPTPRESPGDIKSTARTKKNSDNTKTVSRTVQIPDPTKFFISPPSSPFMETRYLVFPGKNNGASSKKPYLVAFPNDVFDDLEEKTDDKEEDELKSIQMTDDATFDTIKLDVRLKQDVINDKSPFSTPVPSATKHPLSGSSSTTTTTTTDSVRRPRKDGRKVAKDHNLSSSSSSCDLPRPPKAAERRDRFHVRNGMLRGIQLAEQNKQAQITHPAKKYIRNDPGRWMPSGTFGKKNIKMAKVTLQYGPNGKLSNPLI